MFCFEIFYNGITVIQLTSRNNLSEKPEYQQRIKGQAIHL